MNDLVSNFIVSSIGFAVAVEVSIPSKSVKALNPETGKSRKKTVKYQV